MADSKPAIGVNKLHEEGLTGKGIKVGVIDTGIDYSHPDLKSSYKGETAKDIPFNEAKGWDFVNKTQTQWKLHIKSGKKVENQNL